MWNDSYIVRIDEGHDIEGILACCLVIDQYSHNSESRNSIPVPDDALDTILDFCGSKQFIFLGLANKQLYQAYKTKFGKETSLKSVVESKSRIDLWLSDMKITDCTLRRYEWRGLVKHAAGFAPTTAVLDYVLAMKPLKKTYRVDLCSKSAKHGRLDLLQHLRSKDYPWGATCPAAAQNGHLEVLKWALENGCPDYGRGTCYAAALGGHLEILQWEVLDGFPWDDTTCHAAALGGHLEVLQWLRGNNCPWSNYVSSCASKGGHFKVLKWAIGNGCGWHEDFFEYAAKRGDFEMAKWARENGAPWDESVCVCMAAGGNLEMLKWARENGAPWSWIVCKLLAEDDENFNLEMLNWASDNGAPCDEETYLAALKKNSLDF